MDRTGSILALIPARGGSKGIPRKNILPLGGKPLIAWTIASAKDAECCNRIIVSTDDEEIAEIAKREGAEVPFLRPTEIAQDDTPDFPVFEHAMQWLQEHEKWQPEIVVWLRPTSPLRLPSDISEAVELLQKTGADAVRSIAPAEHHPFWMKKIDTDLRLTPLLPDANEATYPRRQLLPPVYSLTGLVDVIRVSSALKNGVLFGGDVRGYRADTARSREIDSPDDLAMVEHLLSSQ